MNFKTWLESKNRREQERRLRLSANIDADARRRIWEKITTEGMPVHRGERPRYSDRPYSHDAGDLGRGVYYDTVYAKAKHYGPPVRKSIIKLKNPIVLTSAEAYELADTFHTVRLPDDEYDKIRDPVARRNKLIANAQALTDFMISKGHDGLVCIGGLGSLEIVDYRPYIK